MSLLARLATTRPWLVIAAVLLVLGIAGGVGAPRIGEIFTNPGDPFEDPASQSVEGRTLLERASGEQPGAQVIAIVDLPGAIDEEASRERVGELVAAAREVDGVARTTSWYDARQPAFVSEDGRRTFFTVTVEAGVDRDEVSLEVADALGDEPGVLLGGPGLVGEEIGTIIGEDLGRAEAIAMPLLFLASIFVFRSVVAALLPVLLGGLTIMGSFFGLSLVNQLTPMSEFALNLCIALGLGLAVDYALFVVSRFREELAVGDEPRGALRRTMDSAGRTVLYSGLTVAAAMGSLLVFPQVFMRAMGIGGVLTALIAVALALTLLPAILALLGPRVDALGPRRRKPGREASEVEAGGWYRLSRFVMRRPVPVAAIAASLLVVVGLPFLGVEFEGIDSTVLPADNEVRVVSEALDEEFPPNPAQAMPVVVRADQGDRADVQRIAEDVRAIDGVDAVTEPRHVGGEAWTFDLVTDSGDLSATAKRIVEDVTALASSDHEVYVAGGSTARFVDQRESLASRLPLGLALIATTTVVLLFLLTGSVVLPFKALLMNLLSVSAAFGILVAIFQWGHLEGVLDYESQGALEMTQPILLFALAFGLSTDYGVFLLTRIKEARDAGASNEESVAIGVERTGRIVTAAALLFCIAMGAFALSRIVFIKELGIGTAVAVIIDATIVRAFLVPSLMAMLGSANWWAPGPLRRLHDRFGLGEGGGHGAPSL